MRNLGQFVMALVCVAFTASLLIGCSKPNEPKPDDAKTVETRKNKKDDN